MTSRYIRPMSQRNFPEERRKNGVASQMDHPTMSCAPIVPPSQFFNSQSLGAGFGTSGSVSFHPSVQQAGPNFPPNIYQSYPQPAMWTQSSIGQSPTPYLNSRNCGNGQYNYDAIGQNPFPLVNHNQDMVPPDGSMPQKHYPYSRRVSIRKFNDNKSKMLPSRSTDAGKVDEQKKPKGVHKDCNTSISEDSQTRAIGVVFMSSSMKGLEERSVMGLDSPVLMEIIGILNSQVTELKTIRRKSFCIKDSHGHTAICHYFETDRPLCKMCRGKSYRCVGRYNERKQVFHAFSIREATTEDVRLYRRLVAVGNSAFKNLKGRA